MVKPRSARTFKPSLEFVRGWEVDQDLVANFVNIRASATLVGFEGALRGRRPHLTSSEGEVRSAALVVDG